MKNGPVGSQAQHSLKMYDYLHMAVVSIHSINRKYKAAVTGIQPGVAD